MHTIEARNIHQALPEGLHRLRTQGIQQDSRNGPVIVMPGPVTTCFLRPCERVIFHPERDANPFFHLMESLWMLAGRNDLEFLTRFVQTFGMFSDDGKTLHGAYGHRWRTHFGFDQLGHIIATLRDDPTDRRQVLQMWDANMDLGREGKDLPCNTHVYFLRGKDGALNMTVCCRSNDIIWGAYGANAVHFSMLQEYIAAGIGCPVGLYWQMSNNYHAYVDKIEPLAVVEEQAMTIFDQEPRRCPYSREEVIPYPLVSTPIEQWQQDLLIFLEEGPVVGLRDSFFRRVATPMLLAHQAYSENQGGERYIKTLEILQQCRAEDWKRAAEEWILRRHAKFLRSADNGVDYS